MENYSPVTSNPMVKKPVSSRRLITLLVVVALFALGIGFLSFYLSRNTSPVITETREELPTGEILITAADDNLVSTFPKELILDEGVEALESYSLSYVDENINMPVASFKSSLTYHEAIYAYGEFIKNNNWEVVNEPITTDIVSFWYAKKDGQDLLVTFEDRDNGVFITVAYSKNSQ